MDVLSCQQPAIHGTLGACLQACIFHHHWWTVPWICLVPSWIHTSGPQKWWSHTFNISVEKRSPPYVAWICSLKFPHYTFCPVCVLWRPSHQVTPLKLKLFISAKAVSGQATPDIFAHGKYTGRGFFQASAGILGPQRVPVPSVAARISGRHA